MGSSLVGVLHSSYHLAHLEGSATDIVGNVVGLGLNALLGIVFLLPGASVQPTRRRRSVQQLSEPAGNKLQRRRVDIDVAGAQHIEKTFGDGDRAGMGLARFHIPPLSLGDDIAESDA